MINIEIGVAGRKIANCYPPAIVIVSILPVRNAIIGFNIGHIIIVGMIIAHRPPSRLGVNVYA
jgi:hypothetical protein